MSFGSFQSICETVPLPLCALVGPYGDITSTIGSGIEAKCYSRTVEAANTIIFQAASDFVHIGALVMCLIMVFHVRSKFTAVGRKEITSFFYLFMLLTICSLCLDSGVIPIGSTAYAYFVAAQCGLTSATCTCLLINGFIGFQVYEDGTTLSVWLMRICSLIMFFLSSGIAICTFQGYGGLGPQKTMALFVLLYIVNGLFLLVYVGCQILLVLGTLEERWPLGDIAFAIFFFSVGQVMLYVFSVRICETVYHYLDGLFFASICNLLAVMMVYKYWDSITKEDLEFSVGTKTNVWEVKEPLLDDSDRRATIYDQGPGPGSDYGSSTTYHNSSSNRLSQGYYGDRY
ncbi:chitin synthase III catalytic subunit [Trichophaea hybrida]|nr:chitin synthase III catalytic subunit [Trichophaea hybrida]